MLYEISKQIEGHTICALGDGAAWPVQVRSWGLLIVNQLLFVCEIILHGSQEPHHQKYFLRESIFKISQCKSLLDHEIKLSQNKIVTK